MGAEGGGEVMADGREVNELEFCRSLAMMAVGPEGDFYKGYGYLLVAASVLLASGYAEADLGHKAIEAGDAILRYAEEIRASNPELCSILKIPVPRK
jgi:hypothetical protein